MQPFPVTNSNLSASHLAVFLQERYALGSEASCKIVRAGINDTYLVNARDRNYVFRVYSYGWRSRAEITEEISLLELLRKENISVSYAVPDKGGEYIQVLNAPEGERFSVLFTYAAGEKLHNYPEDVHQRVGELMGRFHKATEGTATSRTSYTLEELLIEPLKEIAAFLPEETEEMGMMRNMQKVLLQEFAVVNTAEVRSGIVHLDIWFDNVNITRAGEATMFDFDFCGNGWLCLDIAYYLMQLYFVEPEQEVYRAKAEAFLSGYEGVCKLTSEERRILPMLGVSLYFYYLGVQCRRFDNYSNVFLSETYLKRYITHRVKRYFDLCH